MWCELDDWKVLLGQLLHVLLEVVESLLMYSPCSQLIVVVVEVMVEVVMVVEVEVAVAVAGVPRSNASSFGAPT